MTFLKMNSNLKPLIILVSSVILLQFEVGHCEDFHRGTTGVTFSAYVKNTTDRNQYSMNEIKAMMKLISGRFSKVMTFGVGAGADPNEVEYVHNVTYYQSYPQVFSAEAAALANQEITGATGANQLHVIREHNNTIKMILGIRLHDNPYQLNLEVELANECAQKANIKFPQTVQGFILDQSGIGSNLTQTKTAVEQLVNLKESGMRVGTRQNCSDSLKSTGRRINEADTSELVRLQSEIILDSDFIVCTELPDMSKDPRYSFKDVAEKLSSHKKTLTATNKHIEVMGQTAWPGKLGDEAGVHNMHIFWQEADKWAAQENFTLWMTEAIDNPWQSTEHKKRQRANRGWWTLKDEKKADKVEAYIEKIPSEKKPGPEKPSSPNSHGAAGSKKPIQGKSGKSGGYRQNGNSFAVATFAVILLGLFI